MSFDFQKPSLIAGQLRIFFAHKIYFFTTFLSVFEIGEGVRLICNVV